MCQYSFQRLKAGCVDSQGHFVRLNIGVLQRLAVVDFVEALVNGTHSAGCAVGAREQGRHHNERCSGTMVVRAHRRALVVPVSGLLAAALGRKEGIAVGLGKPPEDRQDAGFLVAVRNTSSNWGAAVETAARRAVARRGLLWAGSPESPVCGSCLCRSSPPAAGPGLGRCARATPASSGRPSQLVLGSQLAPHGRVVGYFRFQRAYGTIVAGGLPSKPRC